MKLKVTSFALLATCITGGCRPKPPALPYLTVGEYDPSIFPEGCGYDWNGAGTELSDLSIAAKQWTRSHDVLMVFEFKGTSPKCLSAARAVYRRLGFSRIYVVSVAKPKLTDPPLIP